MSRMTLAFPVMTARWLAAHAGRGRRAGVAFLAGLVLLAASAALASTAPGSDGAQPAFYDDALDRYREGDYWGAVIQLKNVLQGDPDNIAARLLIGQAYLALDEVAAAEKELRLALRYGADPALVAVPLGDAYLKQGKYLELLEDITAWALPAKRAADVLALRGRAHIGLKQPNQAAADFQAALEQRPDHTASLVGLAQIALAEGEVETAKRYATEAQALDPESHDVLFVLGEIGRVLQDLDAALAHYDRAIAVAPRSFAARLARAAVLMDLGRHEAALADIEFLRAQRPDDPNVAYLHALALVRDSKVSEGRELLRGVANSLDRLDAADLRSHPPNVLINGVAHYALGHVENAERNLKTFLRLRPRHSGARMLLGRLLIDQGKATQALIFLRPALSITPDDPELHSLIGAAHMQLREFADAIAMFERAATLAPASARLHTRLALARIAVGETDRALAELAIGLGGDAVDRQRSILLAYAQFSSGRYREALATVQSAIDGGLRDPIVHNLAGAAQLATGQVAAARASFETVLAIDPAFLPARYNLATLEAASGNPAAAKAHYLTIYNGDARETRAMLGLATIAENDGSLGEAIRWLERVRRSNADAVGPQARLVDVYLRANRPEAALEAARQLQERAGSLTDVQALQALGRAELAGGDLAKAAATFERIAVLMADRAAGLLRVHRFQIAANDVDGARRSLDRALAIDPDSVAINVALIRLIADSGDLDDAMGRASALTQAHPTSSIGDGLRGDILAQLGRAADAAEAYVQALKINPTRSLVVRFYQASRDAGRAVAALSTLESWVQANPADAVAYRALATAYIDVGRYAAATAAHEALIEALPEDAALLNNLAWLYQRSGDPRALGLARRAYALAPDQPGPGDTLGWILVQQGQPARGLTILRDAHARAADVAEIRYHIAVALSLLGRDDDARAELERALASGQRFDGEAEARALLRRLSGG